MPGTEHARGLLAMAQMDFDAMRGMLGNPLFTDEIFGFHAQQAGGSILRPRHCQSQGIY